MANMTAILAWMDSLPSLPHTATRIAVMLSEGRSCAREIEQVARADEGLSAVILRWANSATYGRPGHTFTLKESIARLGTANLTKALLQQQASGVFANAGAGYGLQRGALWRSAYGGALAAEAIAREGTKESPETCFVCALLRDIGKIALDAHFGAEYMDLIRRHTRPDRTFVEAEREALGFDHAELGGALARHWGLPDRIADAIQHHHAPPSGPPLHDTLLDIVHAADTISLWAGLGIGFDGMQYRLSEHVRVGLAIDRQRVEDLIIDVWDGLRRVEVLSADPARRSAAA